LEQLSGRDLKKLLQIHGIDSSTCFEKGELIDLARKNNLNPNSLNQPPPNINDNTSTSYSSESTQRPPPTPKVSPYAHISYYEILDLEKICG